MRERDQDPVVHPRFEEEERVSRVPPTERALSEQADAPRSMWLESWEEREVDRPPTEFSAPSIKTSERRVPPGEPPYERGYTDAPSIVPSERVELLLLHFLFTLTMAA